MFKFIDFFLSDSHQHAAIAEANANIYWEKALSRQHVSKKLSIWVVYGTQMLYFNPMIFPLEHLSLSLVENTVKHIHL